MAEVLKSLSTITTGYCQFEENQVLTHTHLNDLAAYFEDQDRLTRIALLGVGVVYGLTPSVKSNKVIVTRGVGLTTDGDLLQLWSDTTYGYYRAYGASAPTYSPFSGLKAYELATAASSDGLTYDLKDFATKTGLALANMVAVLFMESYVKDEDACSGTDCDNKGLNALNTTKVLLFEKAAVTKLKESFSTLDGAARSLDPLYAERVILTTRITSTTTLETAYKTACNAINTKLTTALPNIWTQCKPFLGDVFTSDPSTTWKAALTTAKSTCTTLAKGIQYYYDFLKDLVDTYNEFRGTLFGDTFVACPDIAAFPKHLLLGPLGAAATSKTRTGFYPAPVMTAAVDRWRHAQSLAKKIDTLLKTFSVPASGTVTITPSAYEDRPLEERAIPYYYAVSGGLPHKDWNYTLTQRGMEAYNYSYNAPAGGAKGAAAGPLSAQLGAYPLFRIEGHLGKDVDTAKSDIESLISGKNLPLDVRAVLLGTDTGKVKGAPTRYTDLHRVHQLLRTDLSYQLADAKAFSGTLKSAVSDAVDDGTIENTTDASAKATVKQTIASKHTTVSSKAASAKTKVNTSYAKFRADDSWQDDVDAAMVAAGEFKYEIGAALRTDFPSPFDSMISSSSSRQLSWLNELIDDADEKATEALLFATFFGEHPGLEHAAGALRGGTFVLVYDTSGIVVGDFMLPYQWPDEPSDDTEPKLSEPAVKSTFVLESGIQPTKTMEATFNSKWTTEKATLEKDLKVNSDVFDLINESMKTITTSMDSVSTGIKTFTGITKGS